MVGLICLGRLVNSTLFRLYVHIFTTIALLLYQIEISLDRVYWEWIETFSIATINQVRLSVCLFV